MKRINVLFILPKTHQGGAETQMLNLMEGLNKTQYKLFLGLLYEDKEMEHKFTQAKGIQIIKFHKKNSFDLAVFFRIARFIKHKNINIVQTFLGNHHSYIPAMIAGRSVAIGGIRGTDSTNYSMIEKVTEFSIPKILSRKNKVVLISNSYAAKEIYLKRGFEPNKVLVIPNGIDIERFSGGDKNKIRKEFGLADKKIITMVGRLVPGKNQEDLLYAFKEITKEKNKTHLLLVGDGPEYNKLLRLRDNLGLANNVTLTKNRSDIEDILAASDIFVFTSKFPEGWPNVIGEAMAEGRAVITYPSGDISRIIRNGIDGIICNPSIKSLKTHILRLLENESLRNKIGTNAKEKIKMKFCVKNMVKEYDVTYRELAKENKKRDC